MDDIEEQRCVPSQNQFRDSHSRADRRNPQLTGPVVTIVSHVAHFATFFVAVINWTPCLLSEPTVSMGCFLMEARSKEIWWVLNCGYLTGF